MSAISGHCCTTQDGGQTWLNRSEGIGENSLRGVYFLNFRQGWTVSHQGNAYYTRDGGKHWTYQRTNVRYELSDVHFIDENRGWIVGDKRIVLATQDGGRNWAFLTPGSNKRHEEQYGQQLRTGDEPLHTFLLYALHFTDTENGWIVGDLGAILHTNDAGRTWKHQRGGATQLPGADVVLLGVHFVNAQLGWTVGEFGTIWHTKNSGRTWELQSVPSYLLTDLHFINDKVGYAVGDRGEILRTDDGGLHWQSQDSGTMECFGSTHFINDKVGWSVAEWGTIIHTTDGGKSWSQQKTNTENNLLGVSFVDPQHGWAIGHSGEILHTANGGKTWQKQRSGVNRHLFGVHFIDAQTGWVVGARRCDSSHAERRSKMGCTSPTRRGMAIRGLLYRLSKWLGCWD